MRRLRKKHANASTLVKAPENYAHLADDTAGVVVNTEVITETVTVESVESEVVSQIEYHNDSTNGEKQLKDDAVDAPADGVNGLTQNTAGEEVTVENVTEAGDVIDNAGLYFASGANGDLAVNNVDVGEDKDEDGDHDVEGNEEDEEKENETGDDNNEQENENLEEEEEMENEGEEEVENENVEDEEEMENEGEEEDEEMENEKEEEEEEDEEDLKASNDEGCQVHIGKGDVKKDNTEKERVEKVNVGKEEVKEDNRIKEGVEKVKVGKEEVKKDNTKKAGVKRPRVRPNKKGNPVGGANGEKKINGGASGEANIITVAKGGQSIPQTAIVGEAEREKAKEKIEGAEGGSPNKKRKKPKKKKTKIVEEGPKQEATKQEDNKESTPKGKSKAKSMGMIFMCNTKTKNDCFRYKVFGLPSGKKDTVEKIYKGMRLFLYDVDLKLLYGIYKAAAPGGYNIQPRAFKSKFPSQVQFTVLGDCLPLPEEKFKNVLKDNYYTKKKFNTILTSKQVKDLCTLFNSNKQHGDSKKSSKIVKRKPRDQVRSPRYPRYERERERAVMIPSVRAPARLAPPPYAYDRVFEDPYRQPMLTRVDDYRQPVLIRSDADYRRPVLTRHDDYRQPVISRRDDEYRRPVINRRDDDYRPQPVVTHRDDYRQPLVTARRDDYRQQPVTTRRDDYRQQPLLLEDHVGDPYSRVDRLVVQRHDIRPLNEYSRRVDPVIPYRGDSGYARDDVATVDPYTSTIYRDRVDTNGGVYAERDNGVAVLPEYRSVRTRYQYY